MESVRGRESESESGRGIVLEGGFQVQRVIRLAVTEGEQEIGRRQSVSCSLLAVCQHVSSIPYISPQQSFPNSVFSRQQQELGVSNQGKFT